MSPVAIDEMLVYCKLLIVLPFVSVVFEQGSGNNGSIALFH